MTHLDPRLVAWRRTLRSGEPVELGARRWLRRRPTVVVDEAGVRIRPGILVPWAEVVDVEVFPVHQAPDLVELVVTEGFHARWVAGRRWWGRAMWGLASIWRPDDARFVLPGVRAGEAEVLGAFLRGEARRRGRLRTGESSRPSPR